MPYWPPSRFCDRANANSPSEELIVPFDTCKKRRSCARIAEIWCLATAWLQTLAHESYYLPLLTWAGIVVIVPLPDPVHVVIWNGAANPANSNVMKNRTAMSRCGTYLTLNFRSDYWPSFVTPRDLSAGNVQICSDTGVTNHVKLSPEFVNVFQITLHLNQCCIIGEISDKMWQHYEHLWHLLHDHIESWFIISLHRSRRSRSSWIRGTWSSRRSLPRSPFRMSLDQDILSGELVILNSDS